MRKANLIQKSDKNTNEDASLLLYAKDLSDIRTLLFDYPNSKTNEEVPKKKWYSMKEARGVLKRTGTLKSGIKIA